MSGQHGLGGRGGQCCSLTGGWGWQTRWPSMVAMPHVFVDILESAKLHTLKGWILQYVDNVSIKKAQGTPGPPLTRTSGRSWPAGWRGRGAPCRPDNLLPAVDSPKRTVTITFLCTLKKNEIVKKVHQQKRNLCMLTEDKVRLQGINMWMLILATAELWLGTRCYVNDSNASSLVYVQLL